MDTDHFGQPLRQARLKAGRTLDDISRRTKIPMPQLERVERGDLGGLPADVFVCGFLRAYARELGIDGEAPVAMYRRAMRASDSAPLVHAIDRAGGPEAQASETSPETSPDLAATATQPDAANVPGLVDELMTKLASRVPLPVLDGRGSSYALVVLLVVLVATITLSILLGGDPRPGRGLS